MAKPPLILDSPPIRVLALDTSTATGWAHDDLNGGKPIWGTWPLGSWKRDLVDHAFAKLLEHVSERIATAGITHVAIEEPLNVYAHSGWQGSKARKDPDLAAALLGFWACATGMARARGCQVFETSPATVRRHFIGHGRHPDPKAAVMGRCRQLGWKIENDNEADALSIWDYTKSVLDPGFAHRGTPLFGGTRQ